MCCNSRSRYARPIVPARKQLCLPARWTMCSGFSVGGTHESALDCLGNRGDDSTCGRRSISRTKLRVRRRANDAVRDQAGGLWICQFRLWLQRGSARLRCSSWLLHTRTRTFDRQLLPEAVLARTSAPRPAIARLLVALRTRLPFDQLPLELWRRRLQQLQRELLHQIVVRFVLHQEPGSLLRLLQTEVR